MESYQELQHWGIKGQKWGIRRYQNDDGTLTEAGKRRYRYQNPDGSLTDEGKAHYMEAARKGKLNPKKLSDADLNMINSRFARENTFKQNVENYQKNTFSYKAKEAVLARIKGNGGGGGGKKGGGGSALGKILAMPIKAAFANAFSNANSGGGGGDDDSSYVEGAERDYSRYKKNGHRMVENFKWSKADQKNRKRWEKEGKRFYDDSTGKNWKEGDDYGKNRNSGSRTAEQIMRDRYKPQPKKPTVSYAMKQDKKQKNLEDRAAKSGLVIAWHSDMTSYKIVRNSDDELMHYGIKGQKWGVRRFQNVDGTYTAEGKERYGAGREFDKKVKKSEFQNDPELKELYKMEKKELTNGDYRSERKRIAANRPDGLSSKEKLVVDRIQNGEVVDDETVRKIASDHHDEYFALGKKLQVATDETERKAILKQMDDQRRIMDYAYDQIPTLNRENKYEKNLATREDKQSIDPSYRTFSSKAEKAKAEEEYLKNTWYEEDFSKVSGDECQHIFDRVCNLSFNGYDGKPQSDRARSMFDYDPNGYRDYERWVPKYEKSDEWKQIQSERQMLKDKTGYTKAENDFNSASISGAFKTDRKLYDKLSKALSDAQRKYSKRVDASDIKQREHKIEKAFDTEMTKVVLKDLGYEITEANMKYIEGIIWWD